MFKIAMMLLVAVSFVLSPAFAEPTIEVSVYTENIKALDSVMVVGKVTGVSNFKPVKLTVTDPQGITVYAPLLTIGENGQFTKLIQPTLPSFKEGTYTIVASHEDTKITAKTQFTVSSQELPKNTINIPEVTISTKDNKPVAPSGISILADAVNGSDVITITGNTSIRSTDITLIVSSPTGNLVTIAQVTPGTFGDFEKDIKTGGPLWKEDGVYTITANQGAASEYKKSIKVEIKDGVIVPEFGAIAVLILAISIVSIIIFSAKSKLSILPRY